MKSQPEWKPTSKPLQTGKKTGLARTSVLAEDLNVALGAITNTVQSLEKRGFIVRKPYRGVKLTERGRRIALVQIVKSSSRNTSGDDLVGHYSER